MWPILLFIASVFRRLRGTRFILVVEERDTPELNSEYRPHWDPQYYKITKIIPDKRGDRPVSELHGYALVGYYDYTQAAREQIETYFNVDLYDVWDDNEDAKKECCRHISKKFHLSYEVAEMCFDRVKAEKRPKRPS